METDESPDQESEVELVDFGSFSGETKGFWFEPYYDGGLGYYPV